MLLEIAGLLVASGILLLVIGIFIARQYTLRAKLVTAFLVIVTISLAVLALLDAWSMSESLKASANKSLLSAARHYADRIDRFNEENARYLQTEAALPAINKFLIRKADPPYNRQALLEILRALASRQQDVILSYAILDRQGVNILDTNQDNIGADESQQAYFRHIAGGNAQPAYRSPVLFEQDQPVIIFASAINDLSGRLIGVLRAKYDARILHSLFDKTRDMVGRGSFALLLDENLLRLMHGRRADLQYTLAARLTPERLAQLKQQRRIPPLASGQFAESQQWREMLSRASVSDPVVETRFYGLGTVQFSSAVVRLNTAPWTIVISLPQAVFLEPVEQQTRNALFLLAVIVLAVIVIVMLATQLLLGPVKRLTNVVKNIASGDLKARANVEAEDEIGSLAQAFNEMTENLGELIVHLEKEVSSHKRTAENLNKLSQAIEQSPVSVMITDLDGNIEYVNQQLCRLSGYGPEELIGQNPRIFKSGDTPDLQYRNLWHAITNGQSWSGELKNRTKSGRLFWENVTVSPIRNADGEVTHYLAIKEDISLRKEYEDRLLHEATIDKLTNLPNRTLAYDRVEQAIVKARKEHKHVALLYMDFDHFKNINDTLGHESGDRFLCYMAGRLKACVRDIDTVARLGGDEFLIMLLETDNGNDDGGGQAGIRFEQVVRQKTEEILRKVAEPCVIEGMEFAVTASVGIAVYPQNGDDPHILLRNADTAMYRSKRKGRNTYEIFTTEMGDRVMKQVEIDNKLRRALEHGDFYLHYQALLDARSNRIVGAEALIRWQDDILGEVSPEEFVPLAEESGLIVDIGHWVLDTALAQIKQLRELPGGEDMYIAINLSSRQFRSKDIVESIAACLQKHALPGDCLELEITERLLMKDVPQVIGILERFKEMGIRLSIDDFGTGYSSLSYLRRFPFDVLKIDRAFIADIGHDPDDTALCEAIIAMAHSLGLSIIAEGVEKQHQFDFLQAREVEVIQGYFVSRPLDDKAFTRFLSEYGGA